MRWFLSALKGLAVSTLLALGFSCGGGGSSPQPTFSLGAVSATFTAHTDDGSAPAPQDIAGTITNADAPVYLFVEYTNRGLANVAVQITGQTTGRLTLTPRGPRELGPGTYTDTVTVRACLDSAGTRNISGSPKIVTVSYQVATRLVAGAASLKFDTATGGPLPPTQNLALTGSGVAWQATTSQPWIKLGATSGTAPSSLGIGVDPAGLAAGTYTGTVTLASVGTSDSLPIPVQLTVSNPGLATNAETLAFSGINGAPLPSQALTVAMNNQATMNWTATAGAPWIVLDKTSGSTPGSLAIAVDPSRGPLASGGYVSAVTVTASNGGSIFSKVIPVSLSLTKPTLTVTPDTLVGGGATGRDLRAQTLSVSLNTGTALHPWTATPDHAWIVLDARSGTTSATPKVLQQSWNRQGLAAGGYTGAIEVAATVNGDQLKASIPVSLRLDEHRLLVEDDGVAFASLPGLASLSRSLKIRDNFGQASAWTATSDQPWLSVTPSGTTPGSLTLSADPKELSLDAMHYATVFITSADTAAPERIRVGFWVGATAPAANVNIPKAYTELVLDPIRPYAYVHAGGSDLSVVHLYTGALVATLPGVAGKLGGMAVASDGSTLFLFDSANQAILPVALPALAVGSAWPTGSYPSRYLGFLRTNGKRMVIGGNGHFYDAGTGADLVKAIPNGYFADLPLSTSLDGTRLVAQDTGSSPSGFFGWTMDFIYLDGGTMSMTPAFQGSGGSNGQDIAVNADGTRIYSACGGGYGPGYNFGVFNAPNSGAGAIPLTPLPGDAYPNNVEVAKDGRVFCGASVWYGPKDVWIYNASTGALLASFKLSGYAKAILPRQFKVSSDGLRLVVLTDDPALKVVSAAP